MSGWKRWKEPAKTLLILLLTASAAFLILQSRVFSGLISSGSDALTPAPDPALTSFTEAAMPTEAAVTGQSGLCYGVKYDDGALNGLYQEFSPYLGEAIGSAEEPMKLDERIWFRLLGSAGLYLNYDCDLPLQALAAWLGVETRWEQLLSALILAEDGDGGVLLAFRDSAGKCYASKTAASWENLLARGDAYLPNGAAFASQWDALGDCDPAMLVLEKLPELYAVAGTVAQEAPARLLAEWTEIRLSSQSCYSEPDGTLVYPGENGVLRLHGDGGISCTMGEGAFLASADSVPVLLERSRALAEELHAAFAGEELLRCDGCQLDGSLTGTVSFSYRCQGLPVLLRSGSAAVLSWENGRLTELSLQPRSYRLTGQLAELLPEKQAAAAAGSRKAGSRAELVLYDGGEDVLLPFWQVK